MVWVIDKKTSNSSKRVQEKLGGALNNIFPDLHKAKMQLFIENGYGFHWAFQN